MNKHAIRYAMLGRVRFDVHPGTFWPSQVRFGQGAFGRGYVLTRYRTVVGRDYLPEANRIREANPVRTHGSADTLLQYRYGTQPGK